MMRPARAALAMFLVTVCVPAPCVGLLAQSADALVSMYERPERVAALQIDRVIDTLKINAATAVADVGAGSGVFSRPLARRIGSRGVVYAADIDAALLQHIETTARQQGLANLKTVLADPSDPKLPEPVDLVLMVDVLHQIGNRVPYLTTLRNYLKPGGRVAVIDLTNNWPSRPDMRYTADDLPRLMTSAGFRELERYDFVAGHFFMIFGR